MLQRFQGRRINPALPVQVYRNTHKGGYSVRQNGLVVGHTRYATLLDADFVVQEAGRRRVVQTGRKNVHAWVSGTWVTARRQEEVDDMVPIHYNPKRDTCFMSHARTVRNARIVYLDDCGAWGWMVNDW